MNTINETSVATYKVEIRSADGKVGDTVPTSDHAAVKEQYVNLRAVYPQSKLLMQLDGSWFEASDDEMARSASVNAALALAGIYQDAPRITWVLQSYEPGVLLGQADTVEQVDVYAALLDELVTERASGDRHRTFEVSGTFGGVPVRVSCRVRIEQPAEVSS